MKKITDCSVSFFCVFGMAKRRERDRTCYNCKGYKNNIEVGQKHAELVTLQIIMMIAFSHSHSLIIT